MQRVIGDESENIKTKSTMYVLDSPTLWLLQGKLPSTVKPCYAVTAKFCLNCLLLIFHNYFQS